VADLITVYATTDPSRGTGISAFVVEKELTQSTSATPSRRGLKNLTIRLDTRFSDCRVPKENLSESPAASFFMMEHVIDPGRSSPSSR